VSSEKRRVKKKPKPADLKRPNLMRFQAHQMLTLYAYFGIVININAKKEVKNIPVFREKLVYFEWDGI
jgi:hypothetical protein